MPAGTVTITIEDAEFSSRSVTLVLAITAMLGIVNLASLGAFMPAISNDLAVSIPVLGQVTTATFLGATGISIVAGPLADVYGKRRLLVLGLGTLAISAFGTLLAPSFGWLLVARLITAISGGVLAGTTLATAGQLFRGDERRRAMSWIASGIAAGAIVGIPTLTLVAALTSWRGSYAVVTGLALIGIILIQRLLPDDAADGGRLQVDMLLAAYRPLLHDRNMMALNGSTITRAIAWVGTLTYVGAYLGDALGLSTSEIGWAYMAGGGGYFLGTKLAGSRLDGRDLRAVYGLGTVVMGVLLGLAMAVPLGPIAVIGMVACSAVAGGFAYVSLVTLVSTTSPAGQGTTMSLNAAMFQFGSALGGLFGGLLLAAGGYTALGLGLMVFAFFGTALVWRPSLSTALPRSRPVPAPD
jgi:DHA1 family inner membrane transport protein